MIYLFYSILLINSSIFFFLNHPLSMGFLLMIQTVMISLFLGLFTLNFWFSYILFLIFMGGMLILFMYMTSLASNEMFYFYLKWNNMMKIIIFSLIMIMILKYFMNTNIKSKILNYENFDFFNFNILMKKENLLINKMMNFPINMINIMMIIYLFITLIATVKISNIFKGPLRPKI